MALFVAVVVGAGAAYVGAAIGTAILVGIGAAAIFDYVMDSMMEDIAVDTMGGRAVTRKDPTASRKIVYGTVRTGGTIIYQANNGTNNEYLHNVVVFSEGVVDEISEIYLDDVKAASYIASSGAIRYHNKYSSNADGSASALPAGDSNDVLRVNVTEGIANQALVSFSTNQWTADHDLSGIAHAYIRLRYNDDIYTTGFPKITAIIKGKKLYDPRQDGTATDYSGSGSQRINNPSTWEYTNNSAVCLLNYMLDERIGLGESLDAFDAPSLLASMNDCDVDISLSGGGTQKKYTCDGIIDSKNSHKANIQNILTSMNGQLLYSGGKYHVKSYNYETPHSQVVTEDMILSNIDVATKASRRSLYNRVKGKFVSEEDNYVMTEYPAQIYYTAGTTTKQFEIDDGETLYHEYNLPMTTNNVRAQRLARLTMLRSRMQSTIKFTTNAKGLLYTVGDNIKVTNSTLGITEKIYQIMRLNVRPDAEKGLTVDIEAKENVEDLYNWSADDALDFSSGLTVNLHDGTVNPVVQGNSYSVIADRPNEIYVYWVQPENRGTCSTRIQIDFPDNPSIVGFDQTVVLDSGATGELYFPYSYQQAGKAYRVSFTVTDQATGKSSEPLIGTGNLNIYIIGTSGVRVEGTIVDPTPAQLTILVEEAGLTLSPRDVLNYVLLDANGNFIDSQQYNFVQNIITVSHVNTSRQTIESDSESNLMQNGNFDYGGATDSEAFWGLYGDNVEVSNGKLVFTNAGEDDYALYKLPDHHESVKPIAGHNYKLKFQGVNAQNFDDFHLKFFNQDSGQEYTEALEDVNYSSNQQYATDFSPSADVFIFMIAGNPEGTTNISFEDFSLTPYNEQARHKVEIKTVEGLTAQFTATLIETSGTDPQLHSLTMTGFDGQQQTEATLDLTRQASNVGETILTYDIKAAFPESLVSTDETTTIASEQIIRIQLRVEVL